MKKITIDEWKKIHKDYKVSKLENGRRVRSILTLHPTKGTILQPVELTI